ncbi:MAG: ribonuclease H-like domain-containing protein [Anaerolineales bacterium]|jgi:uncharacterized protein YprB with RNaseH-like and TPR domain|nr:ribonuclease H-like domain-containing protein [Anaerolineales bacterium]
MSSSISDRLKALGVRTGAQGINRPAPRRPAGTQALAEALGGRPLATPLGEAFVVETRYPLGQPHGRVKLELAASLEGLSRATGQALINQISPEEIVFLDTETTGLSGGTGTYAFLIGVGRFDAAEFVLHQYLLSDPLAEPAQLAALEAFLAPCRALATFNGKTFDAPLLFTRYTIQGLRPPLKDLAHIDLLHLARRLWRDRLPSRTLANLETHILGASRSELDLPGWMIPQIYFDFLQTGDPQPLKGVIYHNAMDVVSLAALLDHMAGLINDPLTCGAGSAFDLLALARLFENLGEPDRAVELYIHGLEHAEAQSEQVPRAALLQALLHLALIYKRRTDLPRAVQVWEQAARFGCLEAQVELAKCHEHQFKDLNQALRWTRSAIALTESETTDPAPIDQLYAFQKRQRLAELQHRLNRLLKKLGSSS